MNSEGFSRSCSGLADCINMFWSSSYEIWPFALSLACPELVEGLSPNGKGI